MTNTEIDAIVNGLDPVDWVQLELLARLPPEQRIVPALRAQAFALAAVRGTLEQRFPALSPQEINLKVLAHFTPLRGGPHERQGTT